MPHSTTSFGGSNGPWLVSIIMWWNCMQFVSQEGVHVADLHELALTKTNLKGMHRWGYVTVAPDRADPRPKPPKSAWLIRATAIGRQAQEVWQPLPRAIEKRWQTRFGEETIRGLRESLRAVVERIPVDLPDCLPIMGYGLSSKGRVQIRKKQARNHDTAGLAFPVLLARALLAFALDFERKSHLSLAICADFLRVLDDKGIRVSDLPRLAGISKEAASMGLGFLQKVGAVAVAPDPAGSKRKFVRLTAKGRDARESCHQLLQRTEASWEKFFGAATIHSLCGALEPLVIGDPTTQKSPLFQGLTPYPDGWRAKVSQPETLPHFPMVLHRGGYPDGS